MSWRYAPIVKALDAGEVIAYPTEGVWGLGCDPWNASAVSLLLALKHRPWQKGLILVASSMQQIEPLLQGLPAKKIQLLEDSWPGSNTWIIDDPLGWIPQQVKGEHSTVAVRVSAHPQIKALCDAFGGPIISTSANRSGLPPLRYNWQVRKNFGESLGGIVEGELGGQRGPSQIRNLRTGQTVRSA